MAPRISQLQRFFYSHYFYGGLRQAVGVLLPVVLFGGLFGQYESGAIASMGALCLAIIDQPGGPRRFRNNEMLGGIVLGTLTVVITGFASSHPIAIWLLVPVLCFFYSMFTVFGRRGGLIGFACLLLMTLTMHAPLQTQQVLGYSAYSFAGGLLYFVFSFCVNRLWWYREEQQALSVALFATADYIEARSRFYDTSTDLDACYRNLIRTQSSMTEKHQAARDLMLRELPKSHSRGDRLRTDLLNIFIEMVDLLDNMVATHVDYTTLREQLPDSDALVFAHDALYKISQNLGRIALNISRNKKKAHRSSTKAELRALEYELELFRKRGLNTEQPETYALLVQILRRLRNATNTVEHMATHMRRRATAKSVDALLDKSLSRFLTRQELRFGLITSNLRMNSSHFRYALRVSVAALLGMTATTVLGHIVSDKGMTPTVMAHSYWIVLTILIVMKPGFALTRQRNGWRLAGTLTGCAVAFALFSLTNNSGIYLAVLVVSCVLGYSLIQLNYTAAAALITLAVLMAFHFLSPATTLVVGERAVDTVIGCTLALACSYILPWWERGFMRPLAARAQAANLDYLMSGLLFAQARRDHQTRKTTESGSHKSKNDTKKRAETAAGVESEAEAELTWRLARKQVHIAFANFVSAFYRMANEPTNQQGNVPAYNNLLIQNHVLASQISASIPILATLATVPENIQKSLDAIIDLLNDRDAKVPPSIETDGNLAALAYPLKQMIKAAQQIQRETLRLNASTEPPAATPEPAAAG